MKGFLGFKIASFCFFFGLIVTTTLNQYWFEPEDLPAISPHFAQRNTVFASEVVVGRILYPDNQTFAQKRCGGGIQEFSQDD
jgi:hypothetical protein